MSADEFGRLPCVHCGLLQYPDSPFCLACGEDNPVPTTERFDVARPGTFSRATASAEETSSADSRSLPSPGGATGAVVDLHRRIEELEAALKPFAEIELHEWDHISVQRWIWIAYIKAARAALEEAPSE